MPCGMASSFGMKPFNVFLPLLIAVALILAFASTPSIAADDAALSEKHDQVMQRLNEISEELELSEQQRADIAPILKLEMADLAGLRNSDEPRRKKAKRLKEITNRANAGIRALLGPEQQEKFDVIAANARERFRERIKEQRDAR